jgi:hypothetical protein
MQISTDSRGGLVLLHRRVLSVELLARPDVIIPLDLRDKALKGFGGWHAYGAIDQGN